MFVKLLTEHNLEFLSLKGGCRGSSESTHVKMPHYWKSLCHRSCKITQHARVKSFGDSHAYILKLFIHKQYFIHVYLTCCRLLITSENCLAQIRTDRTYITNHNEKGLITILVTI